jgi:hypothetical protein
MYYDSSPTRIKETTYGKLEASVNSIPSRSFQRINHNTYYMEIRRTEEGLPAYEHSSISIRLCDLFNKLRE